MYTGHRLIYWVHQPVKGMTQNETMWTAAILQLLKLPFTAMVTYSFHLYSGLQFTSLHSVFHSFHGLINSINWPAPSVWVFIAQAGRALRPRVQIPPEAPKNLFLGGLFCNCSNCDSLRWWHIHFICIPAVHIISFCVSFLSRVDELNKLACSQCMHGSSQLSWKSTAAQTQRPWVQIPLKRKKTFFQTILQLLKLLFTAMVTYSFQQIYCHHFVMSQHYKKIINEDNRTGLYLLLFHNCI